MAELIKPHGGGKLVNRFVSDYDWNKLLRKASKTHYIFEEDVATVERIADGALSPLIGPMGKKDLKSVLENNYIVRNGKKYAWTIPIVFPVFKSDAKNYKIGDYVLVRTRDNIIVGVMEVTELYDFNKKEFNKAVYATERTDHPGPRIISFDSRERLMAGNIWTNEKALSKAVWLKKKYWKYLKKPQETRELFAKKGWQNIIAFQTRNPLHRAHEYAMVWALEKLLRDTGSAGVVLNPLVGATKGDDVPADIRLRTYEALVKNKLIGQGDIDEKFWQEQGKEISDLVIMLLLDIKMYYAGPKEAVMHAIYRQNFGFSHIIIGRRHADAPFDNGEQVWGDFEAQEIFNKLEGGLEIKPVEVGFAAYFNELGKVGLIDEHPKYKPVSISGKDLRAKLTNGEAIDPKIMRQEVAEILIKYYQKQNAKIKDKVSAKG